VLRISVRANRTARRAERRLHAAQSLGLDLAGTNTAREGVELPPMQPGDITTVDFHLTLPELYPGHFSFSPAIADGD
jgi:lipopolysaccharide transport system ATP-binding protein